VMTLGIAFAKRLHLAYVNVARTETDLRVLQREAGDLLRHYNEALLEGQQRERVLLAHEQALQSILLRADEQPAGDAPMDAPQPRDAMAAAKAIHASLDLPTWDARDAARAKMEAGYDVSHLADVRFVRGLVALTRRMVHEDEQRLCVAKGLFSSEGGLLHPGVGEDGDQEAPASSAHGSAKRASCCVGVDQSALKRPKAADADMGNALRVDDGTGSPATAAGHGDVRGSGAEVRGVRGDTASRAASAAGVPAAAAPGVTDEAVQDAPSVVLTDEQRKVLVLVREGHNVFFTGPAGTGKSITLRAVLAALRDTHGQDQLAITASTGAPRATSLLRASVALQHYIPRVSALLPPRRSRCAQRERHHASPVCWRRPCWWRFTASYGCHPRKLRSPSEMAECEGAAHRRGVHGGWAILFPRGRGGTRTTPKRSSLRWIAAGGLRCVEAPCGHRPHDRKVPAAHPGPA
jgi:hypothetical protein